MAPGGSEEAQRLVEEAAEAFENGEFDRALACADNAHRADERSVAALHYRAAALAELGRTGEAREAYECALALDPNDLDLLLGAAGFYVDRAPDDPGSRDWLERGLALARAGGKRARRERDEAAAAELALFEGVALGQLGDSRAALKRIDEAVRALPGDVGAMLERGMALYELGWFEESRVQLEEVVRRAPGEAWAHQTLGLLAERRGDARESEQRFSRARQLLPEEIPTPAALSPEEFDAALEEALTSLPEPIRRYLANVAITVDDLPSDDDLLGADPPLSPSILGIFRGTPYGQKGSMDPWSHFPSSIVLYQRNLERFARDRAELVEEIGMTLVHEVGHFLGLDEEELWERGLA